MRSYFVCMFKKCVYNQGYMEDYRLLILATLYKFLRKK